MADIQLISASTITAIGANSVKELADNPKLTPTALKDYFVKPITSSTNSIISEVNRIVGEANTNINANATAITTETTNRETAVTNEANTRASADTTNANAITQEASDRQSADTTLQDNIDTLTNNLASEVTNRQNADALKVDKEAGKELIPTTELTRLGTLSNYDDTNVKNLITAELGTRVEADQLHNASSTAHNDIRTLISGMQADITSIEGIIASIDGQTDADSVINKLHEVIALLNGYAEGTTLADLLSGKVDKATGYALSKNDLSDALKALYDEAVTHAQSAHLTIGTLATQAGRGDLTQTAYTHSQATHAKTDAINKTDADALYSALGHNHTLSQISDYVAPTIPTISTNITTDATSDTKTASPKAVKDYVDSLIIAGLGGSY